ncbi:VCBS repeat-containing protein [Algoriphagus sp.]|uniref:FG-GAP repeat domain-containing protein n=1 Tax=Algoriphagus sp. TaxID=1872435 RepID=UPI003277BCA5
MKLKSLIVIAFALLAISCGPISERKQPPPSLEHLASMNLKLDGKQLAEAYCGSCHLKPEPEVLDTKTWVEHVLPDMRKRLGLLLPEDFGKPLPADMDVPRGVYSEVPLIKIDDWQKILAYYQENAPETPLPQAEKAVPEIGIPGFTVSQPTFQTIKSNLTTMVRVHAESGTLWVGDRLNRVFILDSKNGFQVRDSILTETAPVDIYWHDDKSVEMLTMEKMDPTNDSVGVLSRFSLQGESWRSEVLLDELIRPVSLAVEDWNGDGRLDRVVSQFGDHVGKMSLYLTGGTEAKEVVLRAEPGARRALAVDFDSDGDMDVLGLMTQAREGVYAWINQGGGLFQEKLLLSFNPVFGSSDFRYEDVNKDGHKDLIVVNGDNADLSIIPKYFHGVRVYLNDGQNQFSESWFYPIYGASSLELADFDGDGDLDLFVMSFYPESSQAPKQDLLYFRQDTAGGFEPFVMEQNFEESWMTLTAGDIDKDGDVDVFLGAFDFEYLYRAADRPWRPIIFLENTSR